MKKTILTSVITTIVVMGIIVLFMHCPLCSNHFCNDKSKCSKDSTEQVCDKHKGNSNCCKKDINCKHHAEGEFKHHGCEHHGKPKCKMHGGNSFKMMSEMLQPERAEFDKLLSDEEKAEISRIKEIFSDFDHNELNSTEIENKYSEEFASLKAIADNHNDEIEKIFADKHKNGMPEGMNEEKMAEMKLKFKMHFLTMDF